MKTWINDYFPLDKLECQYFEFCRDYDPKICKYSAPCELRQWFKEVVEPFVANENLEFQIKLIKDDNKK